MTALERGEFRIRPATDPDAAIVRSIDDAAFPAKSLVQQRASPGALEEGVAAGDVYLLEHGRDPVAYVHLDRTVPAADLGTVERLMAEQQYVVRDVVRRPEGACFVLSPAEPGEFLDVGPPAGGADGDRVGSWGAETGRS